MEYVGNRTWALAGAIVVAIGMASAAAGQEMPTTQSGFYRAGERFAQCSAHFAFAAEMAHNTGLAESAEAFEGMERGWRITGMMLLEEGMVIFPRESGRG